MKKEPTFGALLRTPVVQVYLMGSLTGLGLIVMIELAKANALFALLILLIGMLGIFGHFSAGPLLLLAVVGAGEFLMQQLFFGRPHSQWAGRQAWVFNPIDFLLCLAVIGYLVCQLRLHALTANLFPRDPRLRQEPAPRKPMPYRLRRKLVQKRSPEVFNPLEVAVFLLALPVWVLLAFAIWGRVAAVHRIYGLSEETSQIFVLAWVTFVLLIVVAGILGYWRWRLWNSAEARLFLQDTYWRETRREQRRQYRWLSWARLRGKYRKAGP
jgi:hypothetical protein